MCIGLTTVLPLYFELSEGDLHPYYGLRVLIQSAVTILASYHSHLASYVLELLEYVCIGHIITLPLYFELSEGDLHPYYGLHVLIQSAVTTLASYPSHLASYVLPEEELSEYVCIGQTITLPLYFELPEGDLHPYYGLSVLIQSAVMVRPKRDFLR